ncbi:MAG: phosphate signaling complex protein PhoU [Firmicutes bacterium]|nr:phosphate signaling complex protein PhoU [Bacillota bacterium]
MARNKFQNEMETLNLDLVYMGALVERAIEDSAKALILQDKELCNKVIASDKEINVLRAEIESKALKIILMQQPVASDLRMISTALKMITDMERIGDQARDICEIVLHLCEEEYQLKLEILSQMGEYAKQMVYGCINSFVKQDIEAAKKVIKTDDAMDELFAKLKRKMVKLIKEKQAYADQAIYFLMVGKYFEKIGDHAENIAEWVIFSKTGEHKDIKII